MKILSIDASSHAGWAILEDKNLIKYDILETPSQSQDWPWGIHAWAKNIAQKINELVLQTACDKVIIERATSSRFRQSQNLLDFMHCFILEFALQNKWSDKLLYVDVSAWRKKVDLRLNAEQKKQNQLISKEKKKGNKVVKVAGKRIGRVTKKHLAVWFVNNLFGTNFKIKDNDIADAIMVGYSYFL